MGLGAPGRDFEITEADRAPVQEIQSSFRILLREQGESEQNQLRVSAAKMLPECLEISQSSELCWRQERDFLSTSPGLLPPALALPRETRSALIPCPSQWRCLKAPQFSQVAGPSRKEVMLWFRYGSGSTEPPGNPVPSEERLWPCFLADSLAEINCFGALTLRTSSGKSSSSSSLSNFSRMAKVISISFSWC